MSGFTDCRERQPCFCKAVNEPGNGYCQQSLRAVLVFIQHPLGGFSTYCAGTMSDFQREETGARELILCSIQMSDVSNWF